MATHHRSVSDDALEEALRADVIRAVRGVRGANVDLARYLGVSSVFVSEYMSGAQKQMGLQRALKTMRWLGWAIDENLGHRGAPSNEHSYAWIVPVQRDPLFRRLVMALLRITDRTLQVSIVDHVEVQAATLFPAPARPGAQSRHSDAASPGQRGASRGRRRSSHSRPA